MVLHDFWEIRNGEHVELPQIHEVHRSVHGIVVGYKNRVLPQACEDFRNERLKREARHPSLHGVRLLHVEKQIVHVVGIDYNRPLHSCLGVEAHRTVVRVCARRVERHRTHASAGNGSQGLRQCERHRIAKGLAR